VLGQFSVAAATAVLGYNLASGKTWRSAPFSRRLAGLGIAGSAAALDSHVRVMAGQEEIADAYNAATGAVNRDSMFGVGAIIPANVELFIIVDDAPASNPLNGALDLQRV